MKIKPCSCEYAGIFTEEQRRRAVQFDENWNVIFTSDTNTGGIIFRCAKCHKIRDLDCDPYNGATLMEIWNGLAQMYLRRIRSGLRGYYGRVDISSESK